jgi:hypothetical protein
MHQCIAGGRHPVLLTAGAAAPPPPLDFPSFAKLEFRNSRLEIPKYLYNEFAAMHWRKLITSFEMSSIPLTCGYNFITTYDESVE